MTKKQRAERDNRREWEAERADLIRRALANAAQKRADERARALAVNVKPTLPAIWNRALPSPQSPAPAPAPKLLPAPVASTSQRGRTKYLFRGEMHSAGKIAAILGLSRQGILNRVRNGIPLEGPATRGPKRKTAPPMPLIRVKISAQQLQALTTPKCLPNKFNRRTDLNSVFGEG